MIMDFEAWRCSHDTKLFCPPEGCAKSYGCARDKGWKPGDPSPDGCDGIIRATTRERDAMSEDVKETLRLILGDYETMEPVAAISAALTKMLVAGELHKVLALLDEREKEIERWKDLWMDAHNKNGHADAASLREENGRFRAALEQIAESRDAGRHDGKPESYPAHSDVEMWLAARKALAGTTNSVDPMGWSHPQPDIE